ncbi:DUF5615 family PIN-like protein [Dyadobacter chenwenxiniae]|uniref:DUF5615 family PIN-like protein n=1 Tax=Dyadobacter chenwenxiniae TaxID=2906456 RepID=A0A9X1TDE4_9BACT|nr:DUF5615 family PIN-like protein [Dyadobacter chenwenxiniae]MCF0061047.1 DUF5615 family PIN-like protein [Dyadobacter chenwenxiniae]UON80875.1 DUF5615 family PIN-like protein [Dyadobacter chenwenxiniae]
MKILIDMNLSPLWVDFFAGKHIHSAHWSSIGRATDLDEIIFEYARMNKYMGVTRKLG